MREKPLDYISFSSWCKFRDDPEKWFMHYMTDSPRMLQTPPMAIGSAFDCRVKARIMHAKGVESPGGAKGDQEIFEELFEASVDKHARDLAREDSEELFERYRSAGMLRDLLDEMDDCAVFPMAEARVKMPISGKLEPDGPEVTVVIMGVLDLYFVGKNNWMTIHDWKVNGFYGRRPTSPARGYVKRVKGGVEKMHHKDVYPTRCPESGQVVAQGTMADYKLDWAQQITAYAWLMGREVGDEEWTISVDQICGRDDFVQHRTRATTAAFQQELFEDMYWCYHYIQKGHYFPDLSWEESKAREEELRRPGEFLFRA